MLQSIEVFEEPPCGYTTYDPNDNETLYWKLNKCLYGLKQSGREWHSVISQFFIDNGFKQLKSDPCVYLLNQEVSIIILLVWVDDIIICSSSSELMTNIKESLKTKFKMKDLGPLTYFLGISFKCEDGRIMLNQSLYLEKLLKRYQMDNCKPRSTPCESKSSTLLSVRYNDVAKYREMVGTLIYAMCGTRPDISYAVTKLSQHLSCPNQDDWKMLNHVLRYLKGTLNLSLIYEKSSEPLNMNVYCDSDWGSDTQDRKSVTGYSVFLSSSSSVISWKSKKQQTVALSTCEAEYMAITEAIK